MERNSEKLKNNLEEARQNGTKIRGYTESDAVHPRFAEVNKEVTQEHQREFHFYCSLCNAYFAPTIVGLRQHFKVGRIDHEQSASCIYCQGPVYNYTINNIIKVYHDCEECL